MQCPGKRFIVSPVGTERPSWPQLHDQRAHGNTTAPLGLAAGRSKIPGNDLLSPAKDYHRPWMLNGRVRNGNGCGHPGMLTGRRMRIWVHVSTKRIVVEAVISEPKGMNPRE